MMMQEGQQQQEPSYDRFGFSTELDSSQLGVTPPAPHQPLPQVERLLEHKWSRLLDETNLSLVHSRVAELVGEGVPESMRAAVWTRISFREGAEQLYSGLLGLDDPPALEQIMLDLPRTLPRHRMFEECAAGRASLMRILKAYALYNPQVGYCQGMSYLAAVLLTQMSDESAVFSAFCRLVDGCAGYFEPSMWELLEDAQVFQHILDREMPELADHMQSVGIVNLMYLSKWFMTGFVQSGLPWHSVLRIMDVYLCEGKKALFRFGYTVMSHHSRRIMAMRGLEVMLPFLLDLSRIPAHILVPSAMKVPIDAFLSVAVNTLMTPRDITVVKKPPVVKTTTTVFDSILKSIATPVRQAVKRRMNGDATPAAHQQQRKAKAKRRALGVLSPASPRVNSPLRSSRKDQGLFRGLKVASPFRGTPTTLQFQNENRV